MKIMGSLTIFRGSDEMIRIRIRDEASRNEFVELTLTPHDFAMAVTGLSEVKCATTVFGLEHVGKQKVCEPRTAVCPLPNYSRKELSAWLFENCQEDGWSIDGYLGSQGSVTASPEGGKCLRYRVFKFVEATGAQQ